VRYYFDPVSDRPGGSSDTASMCPDLYHFDVDARNYWLTNTNPNLTL